VNRFSPWLAVGLLWPVALLNYLDRQMLAAVKASVVASIPEATSDADWGFMLGLFKWVYAALSPLGGYVADKFGRRWTIAGSLAVWSAVTFATGEVTSYSGLLVTRALMGISEAFYIPAALALITDHHTARTRSRAVGIHQSAIYCGLILGGFAGYAADSPAIGWRWAFHAAGMVGILYAVPLALLLREAPRTAPGARPDPLRATGELLGNPSFLLMVAYFTLPAIAGWVVRDWMPTILKDRFGLGQGTAGVSATLFVNVAAFAAAFAGGWAADALMRRTNRGRIFVSAAGMLLMMPALVGVGFAPNLLTAILFLSLFGIGWGVFDANNMPILSQVVRPELRATGYGFMNLVSISAGGFADWGFGGWKDRNVPEGLVFTGFAAMAVVSAGLVLLVRPGNPDRRQATDGTDETRIEGREK
jgi:MFS family permease